MRTERVFSICLVRVVEVELFVRDLQREHPDVEVDIYPGRGMLRLVLRSDHSLEVVAKKTEEKFRTYVFHENTIEEALHLALVRAKKTLGLAESCTGGAIAARLTLLPGASDYLLGSIVAYSNAWKERFLHVSSQTLKRGAVSRETIGEMIEGIFSQTSADYAIGVSGIAGPGGGTAQTPVGTVYIGVGKRGERSDIGMIHTQNDRAYVIDMAVQTALSVLWRRLVHNTLTFS
jgi:nicotinamide-nucleotide amidase